MEEREEGEEIEPEGQYFMDLAGNVKKARFFSIIQEGFSFVLAKKT